MRKKKKSFSEITLLVRVRDSVWSVAEQTASGANSAWAERAFRPVSRALPWVALGVSPPLLSV